MRNIHLQAEPEGSSSSESIGASLPRLRQKTNDPATEYARRPGSVRPISDAVAACILCKSGRAVVERQQIKIQLDRETLLFSSPDSLTIATKNGTGEKVLWVINRQNPDALHILGDQGEYIETLPLKGQSTWFGNDIESKRAIAAARRMQNRDMQRMQELHKPDTRDAIAAAQHNASEIARVVSTFPAPADDRNTPADRPQAGNTIAAGRELFAADPSAFEKAERLSAVLAGTDRARAARYTETPVSEEDLANL